LLSDSGPNRTERAATFVRQHDTRVSVTFDDATVAAYDLVVGADGINSDVRRFAVDRSRPAYAGQMAWRSVASMLPHAPESVQFWLGQDLFFGLCPSGEDITYGFGNLTCARLHDPRAGRKRRLVERCRR